MLNPTFDRREALGRMALLLGVAALPATALAAPAAGTRPFLSPARLRLLGAVADTMLPRTDTPGALAAKVPARLDAMLGHWASAATRDAIAGALTRIDEAARTAHGKGFAALPAIGRATLLTDHDKAALKPAPGAATANLSLFRALPECVDPGYRALKGLVIELYYYSPEATATELVYEHVPGKFEPSLKLTAASRPYLGVGGL